MELNSLPKYTVTVFFYDLEKDCDEYKSFSIHSYNDVEAGQEAIVEMNKEFKDKYILNDVKIRMVTDLKINSRKSTMQSVFIDEIIETE